MATPTGDVMAPKVTIDIINMPEVHRINTNDSDNRHQDRRQQKHHHSAFDKQSGDEKH